jgi:hypothetical protein
VHALALGAELKVPMGQLAQTVNPGVAVNVPFPHCKHDDDDVAPVVLMNVPLGQLRHVTAPYNGLQTTYCPLEQAGHCRMFMVVYVSPLKP